MAIAKRPMVAAACSGAAGAHVCAYQDNERVVAKRQPRKPPKAMITLGTNGSRRRALNYGGHFTHFTVDAWIAASLHVYCTATRAHGFSPLKNPGRIGEPIGSRINLTVAG